MKQRVTIADCRSVGWCVSGVRRYCQDNGLDFRTLLKDGFEIDEKQAQADAHLGRVFEAARRRNDGKR